MIALLLVALTGHAAADTMAPTECLSTALQGRDAADRLIDAQGRAVAPDGFAGKTTLVTMLPRDCDTVCAMRMIDLDQIGRALPAAVRTHVAFVLLDTGGRSGSDLKRLAATWKLVPARWTLLRGAAGTADLARRRFDIAPAGAAQPSPVVVLFDAGGRLRQRYSGAPVDRERLTREIATVDTLSRDAAASACSSTSS